MCGNKKRGNLWLQYDEIPGELARNEMGGYPNNIYTMWIMAPAPTEPGTYQLRAYTYSAESPYPVISTGNFVTVVVIDPNESTGNEGAGNEGAGKTTEQNTAYWMGIHYEMFYTTAKTVKTNADVQGFDYVPHYIFDFLSVNPAMTLQVEYRGEKYVLNAANMQAKGVLDGLNYPFATLSAMGF